MATEGEPKIPEFEASPSKPDSGFGKGDIAKKLAILADNRKIDQDYGAGHQGETPPAQDEMNKILARQEEELLEEIRKSGEKFVKRLDVEGRAKTLILIKAYLESVGNDELKEGLNELEQKIMGEEKKNELLTLIEQIDKELSGLNRADDADKIDRFTRQRNNIAAELGKLTGLNKHEVQDLIAEFKGEK